MAAPMSPLIFSLPVMYAVVGFCSPLTIFSKFSSDVEIVQSASPSPSRTLTVPSSTVTSHLPAPSMSNRYVLFIPAVLPASTRVGSDSKNSRADSAMRATLLWDGDLGLQSAARTGRRQQQREHERGHRPRRAAVQRCTQADRVRERAERDRGDAAETDRQTDREPRRHADVARQVPPAHHHRQAARADA